MKDKFIREKIAELESQYHAQFSEATMTFRVKVYYFIFIYNSQKDQQYIYYSFYI